MGQRLVSRLMLLGAAGLLIGCTEQIPATCDAMCDAAAANREACLESMGLGWDALGYADEADFRDACATWAWEQAQILGATGDAARLDAECAARRDALAVSDCGAFAEFEWNEPL